jgi:outer membrane lipoprotein SlyB
MISQVIYGDAQAGDWMADFSTDLTKLKGFHFSGTEVNDGKITSYTLRTVSKMEIENRETTPDAVGGITGAAVGGLLLGPVGAIGGCNRWVQSVGAIGGCNRWVQSVGAIGGCNRWVQSVGCSQADEPLKP